VSRPVRVKTSVTRPKELLGRLDRLDQNRPAPLERAAPAYLARKERRARNQKDIEIVDHNADHLNGEALDTLGYQQLP